MCGNMNSQLHDSNGTISGNPFRSTGTANGYASLLPQYDINKPIVSEYMVKEFNLDRTKYNVITDETMERLHDVEMGFTDLNFKTKYGSDNVYLKQTLFQLNSYDIPEDTLALSKLVIEQLINRGSYEAVLDMMRSISRRYKIKDQVTVQYKDISNFDHSK